VTPPLPNDPLAQLPPRKKGDELGPISAVICNFNGELYLEGCIRALQRMTPGVAEIIVVDNASTDGSLEVIRQLFPEVKLLALSNNGGPCVARNVGMRAAQHRFVLAVDNDAVLLEDTLGKLLVALMDRPDAVAAQPRSVYFDNLERVHYNGGEFHYTGLYALRNFGVPMAEAQGTGVLDVDGLIAICILIDSKAFRDVGGYDEDFFILFEDLDLSMRLRIAGHKMLSVEGALVRHKGGTPGISFRGAEYPKFRSYYHSRNRWLVIYKNYSLRTMIACLPGFLLYEAVWLLFTIKSGHLRAHIAGKLAFFKALKASRALRGQVQASRKVLDRDLLVGGPLTLSPQLVEKPLAAKLARALDSVLRALWSGLRWAAG
jgi:GT2 family glycosyltransferase